MRKARTVGGALLVVAVCATWLCTGVERIPGDHEVGTAWPLFVKQRPSLQFVFENPAGRGLELTPVESMSATQRAAFIDYCHIRFGTTDAAKCQAEIAMRAM